MIWFMDTGTKIHWFKTRAGAEKFHRKFISKLAHTTGLRIEEAVTPSEIEWGKKMLGLPNKWSSKDAAQ